MREGRSVGPAAHPVCNMAYGAISLLRSASHLALADRTGSGLGGAVRQTGRWCSVSVIFPAQIAERPEGLTISRAPDPPLLTPCRGAGPHDKARNYEGEARSEKGPRIIGRARPVAHRHDRGEEQDDEPEADDCHGDAGPDVGPGRRRIHTSSPTTGILPQAPQILASG